VGGVEGEGLGAVGVSSVGEGPVKRWILSGMFECCGVK
jgi:hypothetical protein